MCGESEDTCQAVSLVAGSQRPVPLRLWLQDSEFASWLLWHGLTPNRVAGVASDLAWAEG